MQILDKAITPDGIEIELRDLNGEHKLPDYNGMEIAFRTVAKNTFPPNDGWYAQKGKEFHSCICCYKNYTSNMLKADYEELKNGTKTIADLKSYFWNGKRDCYVLGLEEVENYAENIKRNADRSWLSRKRNGSRNGSSLF